MKFAIVENGGKQMRAVEGSTIEVDRLPDLPGAKVKLEQVLLMADGENVTVGTPLLKDTPVWTTVVEHFRGPKVETFNYSPKKRIRVKIGHRQNYTRLLVEQIGGADFVKKEPVKAEKVKKDAVKTGEQKVKTTKPAAKAATKGAATKPAAKTAAKSAAKKPSTTKSAPKAAPKAKAAPKKSAGK
jgi:large subunit ribosomal protein L21